MQGWLAALAPSVALGVVQGVTEWLPISSKTQILMTSYILLHLGLSAGYVFGLFMEIGTVFSAVVYFWRDIVRILTSDWRMLAYIVVATVFTGLVGAPLYLLSERALEGHYNPGIPMLVLGAVLIADGIYIHYSRAYLRKMKGARDLGLRDVILVGLMQGLSALPGVSRSGMTVSTMLILGYRPEDAFRFSYLLYIPAALGAFGLTLLASRSSIGAVASSLGLPGLLTSVVVAFLVGVLTIDLLLRLARRQRAYVVNYFLGALAIAFSLALVLS